MLLKKKYQKSTLDNFTEVAKWQKMTVKIALKYLNGYNSKTRALIKISKAITSGECCVLQFKKKFGVGLCR